MFKTFMNKVMRLYKWVKGEKEPGKEEQNEESFSPAELEQAFDGAHRSYRINGRSRMDVYIFFDRIRQNLMNREI